MRSDPAARPIEVVALSSVFDLAPTFDGLSRDLRVVRPQDVSSPEHIEVALAWRPDAHSFSAYPNLKMVSSIAAGVDSILACSGLPEHVVITRIRDEVQADMMAGFAAWQVVWHHRRMGDYVAAQKQHLWDRSFRPAPPDQVCVGILGFGLMGRACARAIKALGYRVIAARNGAGVDGVEGVDILSGAGAIGEVAARADILVNVLPLTEATRDVLNGALFARMPSGAAVVQIGRGEHLVEPDLISALDSGHLASASVDVFRAEPPLVDHPFWSHPKILVTPHKASDTSPGEVLRQVSDNFIALREGRRPPGAIDRAAGY